MKKIILFTIILTILVSSCTLLQNEDEEGLALPEEIRQWADSATASSSFGKLGQQRDDQSPFAATGKPDVEECKDDPRAWVIDTQDDGLHWLELTYYDEVHVSKVRVKESYNPGSIVKIEALNNDQYVTLWEGVDDRRHPDCPGFFEIEYTEMEGNMTLKMSSFKTDTIKITLNTDLEDWNEIDAVELVGYRERWYLYNDTIWFK